MATNIAETSITIDGIVFGENFQITLKRDPFYRQQALPPTQ